MGENMSMKNNKDDLWLKKYLKLLEAASWEILNLGGVRPSTRYKLRHYLDEIPDSDSSYTNDISDNGEIP
jgi:hypothetical protein